MLRWLWKVTGIDVKGSLFKTLIQRFSRRTEENHENFNQDSRSPGRESNSGTMLTNILQPDVPCLREDLGFWSRKSSRTPSKCSNDLASCRYVELYLRGVVLSVRIILRSINTWTFRVTTYLEGNRWVQISVPLPNIYEDTRNDSLFLSDRV
jgi:hypothetical protein